MWPFNYIYSGIVTFEWRATVEKPNCTQFWTEKQYIRYWYIPKSHSILPIERLLVTRTISNEQSWNFLLPIRHCIEYINWCKIPGEWKWLLRKGERSIRLVNVICINSCIQFFRNFVDKFPFFINFLFFWPNIFWVLFKIILHLSVFYASPPF